MRYRNTSHLLIALALLAMPAICHASKQPSRETKRTLSIQCQQEVSDSYRTDGQEWSGQLTPGRIQEFTLSFYAGVRYRLAYATTVPTQKLSYRVFDPDRNLLFSSEQHGNPAAWDFIFDSTTECSVVVQLAEPAGAPPEVFALFRLAFRPSP
ncbi:MAG: hypothetical protein CSA97_04490 [Bacteroidetes bacterium]|nr:MAG: hypothetical protein CSA97_04490 [Bacteroidota bacterium]